MTPTECAQLIVLKEVLQQLRQVWEENAALDAREIERQRIRADLAERKLAIVAQALSEIAEGKKSTDLCSNDGQTFLLMAQQASNRRAKKRGSE